MDGRLAVDVPNGKKTLTLYAHEIGYLEAARIYANIKKGDGGGLAELIAASVTDKAGNRFTVEEAARLKKAVAEPLMDAVIKVNGLGADEKN